MADMTISGPNGTSILTVGGQPPEPQLLEVPPPTSVATVTQVSGQPDDTPDVVNWTDIQGKPAFGTASLKDVPSVGDASLGQVVLGSDTRLIGNRTTISTLILDSTAVGRALLTAPTQVSARGSLGLTSIGEALATSATQLDGRNTLGLGTVSTQNSNAVAITGGTITGITDLAIADGGTGASTAGAARTNLGSSVSGDTVFSGTAAAGRTALGSTTVGDALFITSNAAAARDTLELVKAPMGQCYLTKSGSNLLLSRYNGAYLFIDGLFRQIPSSGPTLAPTSLTVDTVYNIYAAWNGSAITLEASTTARATDTTYGHQIKSGDSTRTLVGKAFVTTGPAWTDTAISCGVLNWYNRRRRALQVNTGAIVVTTTTPNTELDTSARCYFLSWGEDWTTIESDVSGQGATSGPVTFLQALIVTSAGTAGGCTAYFQAFAANSFGAFHSSSSVLAPESSGTAVPNSIGYGTVSCWHNSAGTFTVTSGINKLILSS